MVLVLFESGSVIRILSFGNLSEIFTDFSALFFASYSG